MNATGSMLEKLIADCDDNGIRLLPDGVAGQTGLTLQNIDRIGRVIGLRLLIAGPDSKKGK